jgi:hypothetical protein
MLTSVPFILFLIAFALCLISGITGKVPLWIALLLTIIGLLVMSLPKGS